MPNHAKTQVTATEKRDKEIIESVMERTVSREHSTFQIAHREHHDEGS